MKCLNDEIKTKPTKLANNFLYSVAVWLTEGRYQQREKPKEQRERTSNEDTKNVNSEWMSQLAKICDKLLFFSGKN